MFHQRPAISVIFSHCVPYQLGLLTVHPLSSHLERQISVWIYSWWKSTDDIAQYGTYLNNFLASDFQGSTGLNHFLVYSSPVRTLNAVVKRKFYW